MKVFSKMLLHTLTFNVFFAVVWAASVPGLSKEAPVLPVREKLCSKDPTLNISEVCLTLTGIKNDSSAAILKYSETSCDHALYLVHRLCEVIQTDKNLIKEVNDNVTSLLTGKPLQDPNEVFCNEMVKTQTYLGYADNSSKSKVYACVNFCVPSNDIIKPLCRFILGSWNFLKDHPKGAESSNNDQLPSGPITDLSEAKKEEAGSNGNQGVVHIQEPPNLQNPALAKSQKSIGEGAPEHNPLTQQNPSAAEKNEPETNPQAEKSAERMQVSVGPATQGSLQSDVKPESAAVEKPDGAAVEKPDDAAVEKPDGAAVEKPDGVAVDKAEGAAVSQVKPQPVHNPEEDEGDNFSAGRNDDVNLGAGMQDGDKEQLPPPPKPQSSDTRPDQNNAKIGKNGGGFDDDDNDEQRPDEGEGETDPEDVNEVSIKLPKGEKNTYAQSKEIMNSAMDDYNNEAEDSHFFVFFFIATFVCIVFYLIYQNKRKPMPDQPGSAMQRVDLGIGPKM